MLVNEQVVVEHGEEAAFQWLMRDKAVNAPHYSLRDLAKLDDRVAAHLDGVRVAGAVGWRMALETLSMAAGAGEYFVGTVLAAECGDAAQLAEIFGLGAAEPAYARGIASAFGWVELHLALPVLRGCLTSTLADVQRLGVAGCALHRYDPGIALERALNAEEDRLRTRALKAVGELGRADLVNRLLPHVSLTGGPSAFYAAWSAARLGYRSARVSAVLKEQGSTPGNPYALGAVDVAARTMPLAETLAWYRQLRDYTPTRRLAPRVLGALGDPARIDELLGLMEAPDTAQAAGEAFALITGADLAYQDLDQDPPQPVRAVAENGPEERDELDDIDIDIANDFDGDVPWPHPERVRAWWAEHCQRFLPGGRYLLGEPITPASAQQALVKGKQRQRAAAALELALMNSTQPLFEVRAPGSRQLAILRPWIL